MAELTDELISQYFAFFKEDYKCLVYGGISHRHGIFSHDDTHPAFMALTDTGKLLVVELSYKKKDVTAYVFHAYNLRKLKIRKYPIMPIYKVKTIFLHNGSEFKVNINLSIKVFSKCESLQNQEQNAMNLMETLKNWQKYTGAEL